MEKGICYIVGAGYPQNLDFCKREGDLVISADGGLVHLQAYGIVPDLYVGDGDSCPPPSEIPQILLNTEKDCTDTLAAIEEGLRRGYSDFKLLCMDGGRLDHVIANIQCLNYLSSLGKRAELRGLDFNMRVLRCEFLRLEGKGLVSVFSIGERAVVDLAGFKYPLKDYSMSNIFPIGVSNELNGAGEIRIGEGSALVMFESGIREAFD